MSPSSGTGRQRSKGKQSANASQASSRQPSRTNSLSRKKNKTAGRHDEVEIKEFVPSGGTVAAAAVAEADTQMPTEVQVAATSTFEERQKYLRDHGCKYPVTERVQAIPTFRDLYPDEAIAPDYSLPVKENAEYVKTFTAALKRYKRSQERLRAVADQNLHAWKLAWINRFRNESLLRWCQWYPIAAKFYPRTNNSNQDQSVVRAKLCLRREIEECAQGIHPAEDIRLGRRGTIDEFLKDADKLASIDQARLDGAHIDDFMSASMHYEMLLKQLENASLDDSVPYNKLLHRIHCTKIDIRYATYYPNNHPYTPLAKIKKPGHGLSASSTTPPPIAVKIWKYVEKRTKPAMLTMLRFGNLSVEEMDICISPTNDVGSNTTEDGEIPRESVSEEGEIAEDDEDLDEKIPSSLMADDDDSSSSSSIGDDELSVDSQVITNIDQRDGTRDQVGDDREPSVSREHSDDEDGAETNTPMEAGTRLAPDDIANETAALSQREIQDQLRYFHFFVAADNMYPVRDVRCLVCGEKGHKSRFCLDLRCKWCKAFNVHPSYKCPSQARCSRCKETGHDGPACPYKLKNPNRQDLSCSLCQAAGHIETECELLWRSSGASWNKPVPSRLHCYECGSSNHLGNDCSRRKPGKPLGTSTWSSRPRGPTAYTIDTAKPKAHAPQGPARHLKRKAGADVLDSSNEFVVQPPIARSARSGDINIFIRGQAGSSGIGSGSTVRGQAALPVMLGSHTFSVAPQWQHHKVRSQQRQRDQARQPGQVYQPMPSAGRAAIRKFRT